MIKCNEAKSDFCGEYPEKCGANDLGENGVLQEYYSDFKEFRFGCVNIKEEEKEKDKTMKEGFLDIKSDNFLGGINAHHVIIILLLVYTAYKVRFIGRNCM